nr:MAG TPA: hypothetical protein [Caudoviricetes sp.]
MLLIVEGLFFCLLLLLYMKIIAKILRRFVISNYFTTIIPLSCFCSI